MSTDYGSNQLYRNVDQQRFKKEGPDTNDSQIFQQANNKQLISRTNIIPKQTAISFKIGSQKKNIQILRSQLLSAGNQTKKQNLNSKGVRKQEVEIIIEEREKLPKSALNSQGIKTRNQETKMPKLNSQSPKINFLSINSNYHISKNDILSPKVLYNNDNNGKQLNGLISSHSSIKDHMKPIMNLQNNKLQSSLSNQNFIEETLLNQQQANISSGHDYPYRKASIDSKMAQKYKLKPLTSSNAIRFQAKSKEQQQSNDSCLIDMHRTKKYESFLENQPSSNNLQSRKRQLYPIKDSKNSTSVLIDQPSPRIVMRNCTSRAEESHQVINTMQGKINTFYKGATQMTDTMRKASRIYSQQNCEKDTSGKEDSFMPLPRAMKQMNEKQVIIAEYEDSDKKFEKLWQDSQGIRIQINKEQRVTSHMEATHENTNLLFYKFNNENPQEQDRRRSRGQRVTSQQQSQQSRPQQQNIEYTDQHQYQEPILPSLSKSPHCQNSDDRDRLMSRRQEIGFDDGKEFKKSSRKKFGYARQNKNLSDFPYLNYQKTNNKNQYVEDEIEEEASGDEGQ